MVGWCTLFLTVVGKEVVVCELEPLIRPVRAVTLHPQIQS
jgi:hypothetical protein